MFRITDKPVSPQEASESLKTDISGSVVTHFAILRPSSEGPRLIAMEYEVSQKTAEEELSRIESELRSRWQIQDVGLWRRAGRLGMGEIILIAAVSAPHRREAFEACEYAVERLRGMISVKKREIYE